MKTLLPDFNIQALQGGHEYQGPEQGRYGKTPRLLRPMTAGFDASKLLWYMSETSPDLGDLRVTVADGVVYAPDMDYPSNYGAFTGLVPMKQNAVTGSEFTSVVDGEMLWLKIKWAYISSDPEVLASAKFYRGALIDVSDNVISVLTDSNGDTINVEASEVYDVSTELLSTDVRYDGYEWLKSGSAQTDTATATYYKIATFNVDVDVGVDIDQHIIGCPITAQPLIYTFGRGFGD